MQTLFVTSEIHPLIKTGGLADVSGSLPPALHRHGLDVRILVPGYRSLFPKLSSIHQIADLSFLPAAVGPTRLLESKTPDSQMPLLIVDCPALYDRAGSPYLGPDGKDWPDNPVRFGLLCQAGVLLGGNRSPLSWRPDVLHCNDWQTALIPALLHYQPCAPQAKSVLTIHNLAFQGNFEPEWASRLGLPEQSFHMHGVEFHGMLSFLKSGINFADALTTVSKTYAREIQTPQFGCGLDGLLAYRHRVLTGIVNGIDAGWDPAQDGALAARYDASDLSGKHRNKHALQEELGLARNEASPIFGLVSRLTHQKGIDLIVDCAEELLALGAQLAFLGSGDATLEQALQTLGQRHPDRVSVTLGFNEGLAHRLIAGSDFFLMPSRYEPCGLAQMYAMAYGTPPLVHGTGGLADTVTDCTPHTLAAGTATGFLFIAPEAQALARAAARAVALYHHPETLQSLQKNGMESDFGWDKPAAEYADVYRRCLQTA
jgi:starch synthase